MQHPAFHLTPHPALHPLFEALAYTVGFAIYRRSRQLSGDLLPLQQRWLVIAAAAIGALLGSRVLGLLEQAPRTHLTLTQLLLPGGGKTIVGGLLGGWIAVELTKRLQRIGTRTGDLFAVPLCLGIAIGRVGCLLAGLADDTYGTPTSLPFVTRYLSVDFGDGIPRHPTQLYEILFLISLAIVLHTLGKRPHPAGLLFRIFLSAYLTWRLAIDFLKPQPRIAGLDLIQWSCALALLVLLPDLFRSLRRSAPIPQLHTI